jgi:hypothetical protein
LSFALGERESKGEELGEMEKERTAVTWKRCVLTGSRPPSAVSRRIYTWWPPRALPPLVGATPSVVATGGGDLARRRRLLPRVKERERRASEG